MLAASEAFNLEPTVRKKREKQSILTIRLFHALTRIGARSLAYLLVH